MKAKKEFMNKAIAVARISARKWDYAVWAIIVKNNKIIASGTSKLIHGDDPTAHPEIVAIKNICKKLKTRFLKDCILYTTHEPCPMCAAAAIRAKMQGIVFGAYVKDAKNKWGKNFSWRQIDISCKDILKKWTPKLELIEWFERDECLKLFNLSK